MPERMVRAIDSTDARDELADSFVFRKNADGPEGEPTGRWWIAKCATAGCTEEWDVRSGNDDTLSVKLGDRNALLAHARSHAQGHTLRRRR
jgi:hypothetical protein